VMSSPLSMVPITNRSIAYGFLLAGVTILTSGGFTILPSLANQFSASATFSGEDGTKIAFVSNRDGNGEIYVMNAQDGSNQTNLTDNTAFDGQPEWMHSAR
jgi:Tol biopolymer transport system component